MAQQGLFTAGTSVKELLAARNQRAQTLQSNLMTEAAQGAADPAKARAYSLLGSTLGRALGGASGNDSEMEELKAKNASQKELQQRFGQELTTGTPESNIAMGGELIQMGYVEKGGELLEKGKKDLLTKNSKLQEQARRESLVRAATKLKLDSTVELLNNGGDLDEGAKQIRSQEEINIADQKGRAGKLALSAKYNKGAEWATRVQAGEFDGMDSTLFVEILKGKKADLSSFADAAGSVKLYPVDEEGKVLNTTTDTWVYPSELGLNAASGGDRLKTEFDQTQGLRAELDGDFNYSNYKESQLQFSKIKTSALADSAAGDMSLIFAYMKMLDPDSVVREGEQATAENARGVPDSILNIYNKAMNGEKMGLAQRQDFVTVGRKLFKDIKKLAQPSISKIKDIAKKYDLDEDDIFGSKTAEVRILDKFETVNKNNDTEMVAALEALSQDERKILQKMIADGSFK